MQSLNHISWSVIFTAFLGGIAALIANVISLAMIDKVNERLPENERISWIGYGTHPRGRYKQLYPGSRLVLLHDSCLAMMALCFVFLIRFWVFS